MKTRYVMLSLLCYTMTMTAQNHHMVNGGKQVEDSTDVFYQHLQ